MDKTREMFNQSSNHLHECLDNQGELPKIIVVIPAFKVAAHIQDVITNIPDYISDIVVVNDCSPDKTEEIIKSLANKRIHLITHSVNQGVGAATISGYKKAYELGAEIIVKMDGDDQMDPSYLPQLVAPIACGEADYAKGNRFIHIKEIKKMPLVRRWGNLILSFLTKLASGYWDIFDPTNGYTAISADLVQILLESSNLAPRYFFETSMLIELGLLRAVVKDVYIPARYGTEKSSLSELNAVIEYPARLLKGLIRRMRYQYFLRDFNAVSFLTLFGLLSVIFGILWGGYHWIRSFQLSTPATTGTVMIAVLPLILGVQFLLQAIVIDIQNVPRVPIQKRVEKYRLLINLTE